MTASRDRNVLLLVLLGTLCLAMAAAGGWAVWAPVPVGPNLSAPTNPIEPVQLPAVAAPASLPPLTSFAETIQRPLFHGTRRPAVPPPPKPPEPVAPAPPPLPTTAIARLGQLTLLGVVLTPGSKAAILRVPGAPAAVHVREGQPVEGWVVTEVRPDRVIFRLGTVQQEIRFPGGGAVVRTGQPNQPPGGPALGQNVPPGGGR